MGNRYTKVSSIKEVRRGDHVSYKNGWFYHHAIVVQVDIPENTLTVIHYLHNGVGSKNESVDHPAISYARVREEVIDFGLYGSRDKLFRYMYEDHECVSAEEVLARAWQHLDKTRYNVRYHNCEDFAVRCKTSEAAAAAAMQLLVGVPAGSVGPGSVGASPVGMHAAALAPTTLIAMQASPTSPTGGAIVGSAPSYVTKAGDVIRSGTLEEKSKIYEMD